MSGPITISVRDLTAEHIGWSLGDGDVIAEVRHDSVGTWIVREGFMGCVRLRPETLITLAPPPPPDPWADVPMPEVWVVQWVAWPSATTVHSTMRSAEAIVRDTREEATIESPHRIVHLSADGAEVVQ